MYIYIYICIYKFHILLLCIIHKEIFPKEYQVILLNAIG